MSFDLKEWNAVQKKAARAKADLKPTLDYLRQAEVAADQLTGRPEWDVYLQVLQSAVDQTRQQADTLADTLARPDIVNHEAMLKLKILRAECLGRVMAWETAMTLPKDLHDQSIEARDALTRLTTEADVNAES